jgi:hypothetical protein
MFCFPFLQRAGLEQLVADLPLRLQSFTDKDDFYLALLQAGVGGPHSPSSARELLS